MRVRQLSKSMKTSRHILIEAIQRKIGNRKLVWFGTRGSDARPLLALSQFREVYSLTSPLETVAINSEADICLETISKERVDLDTYDLSRDRSSAARTFCHKLANALSKPCALCMYRPGSFLAPIYYPRRHLVNYLGLFWDHQSAFEYKPWVEAELANAGVKVLPWEYFGADDKRRLLEHLANTKHSLVVRTSRTDGGIGVRLFRRGDDPKRILPKSTDHLLAVSRYLTPNLPANVNAVVYRDGTVSIHPTSTQLLGVPSLTDLPFGYCGNDFGGLKEARKEELEALDVMVRKIGFWLASRQYVGAFGIDAVLHKGEVYLAEINPRFQGSSAIGSEIDRDLDRPDMFLHHIAANLGLPPIVDQMSVSEITSSAPHIWHLVCHNPGAKTGKKRAEPPANALEKARPGVHVQKQGMLWRIRGRGEVCVLK